MGKNTIRLNEGEFHNEEITLDKNLKPGEHFTYKGFTYRVIDSTYAQCGGRVNDVVTVKQPRKAAKKKTVPAKTVISPASTT